MKIVYQAVTDVGRKRKGNEDSLFVHPEQNLFVVADGMGGHAAGEVASKVAVDSINEFVCLTAGDEEITWPFGLDQDMSYDGNRLKTAVRFANRKVLEAMKERSEYEGMATTVAAVLVDGEDANLAHVGDSRVYLFRDSELKQLTSDHSWVNEQLQSGVISADQARSHPLRNVVTRALGGKADLQVDMQLHKMKPGDVLLLCSDGLTTMVPDEDIERVMHEAGGDVQKLAQDLVAEANARGGEDNITVVLIQFQGMRSPMPAESTANRPRKRIGKYLITGRIGRGGMGMVYRGYDEALEREVAVKTLTIEGTLDEESRRRFEIEAKAAARLQHPNILTVFELGEERGMPFIAMELLPGMDLEAALRSGEELLLQEKLEAVIQVCRGLAYAHEHKIVHRDIKPSNIRLLDDGTVKIMDFGIAKLQGTGVTRSGMMVGTVHYMSPEQIRGQPLDGRSDVFSLGVILYELLAGRRPFSGQGATEVLYKIVHEDPAPLSQAAWPIPPRLQEIGDRALCKSADARYPNATRLADDLGAVLADLTREATVKVATADVEALNLSRRLLKEGRADESVRQLRELTERLPQSLEARRALRAATRELQRRQRPPEPQEDDFPELDATFQSPPTRIASGTVSYPPPPPTRLDPVVEIPRTVLTPSAARVSPAGRLLVVGASLALALALGAGLFLIRGTHSPGAAAPGPAPIRVLSQPSGAQVWVDGKDSGVVTDGELALPAAGGRVLLTFRKPGYREESRSVTLPLAPDEAVSVALAAAAAAVAVTSQPPGAAVSLDGRRVSGVTPLSLAIDPALAHRLAVSLDGYATQELRLQPGGVTSELRVVLEPSGPLGTVTVASSFPLDVLWKGRVLARGQSSPRVSLPAGRQLLTLSAAAYFLRSNVSVDVRGGVANSVGAPGLGKISIRANPDNCQVLIDGVFVDYPPILDKAIAAGSHSVTFKWPDGSRAEQVAEVAQGRIEYVMGRKD